MFAPLEFKTKVTDRSRDFWKVTAVTYPFGAALNQLWMAPGSSYTHRAPPSPYFVATYLHNSVLLRIPEIRELEPVESVLDKQLWSKMFLLIIELEFDHFIKHKHLFFFLFLKPKIKMIIAHEIKSYIYKKCFKSLNL